MGDWRHIKFVRVDIGYHVKYTAINSCRTVSEVKGVVFVLRKLIALSLPEGISSNDKMTIFL